MELTRNQIIAMVLVALGALTASTAQLTDLFGPGVAKYIISSASLLNVILSGWMVILSGQAGQVRDVLAMPGIQHMEVNNQASQTLATLAVDPQTAKITPVPSQFNAVSTIAKGV